MKIRKSQNSDWKSINEILRVFHPDAKSNIISKQFLKIICKEQNTFAAVAVITKNNEEKIVGFGMINLYPVADKNGWVGKIESVVIDPNYRGYGFGEEICKKLIKFAERRKAIWVELTSNPKRTAAHQLYRKLHFAIRDTCVFELRLRTD